MPIGLLKAYLSKEEAAGIKARVSLKYDHYPIGLASPWPLGKCRMSWRQWLVNASSSHRTSSI